MSSPDSLQPESIDANTQQRLETINSLQPESIDANTQQRLETIKNALKNAVRVKRIKLQVVDKEDVENDLATIFQVEPAAIAIVEIPGPDAAPIKNPIGQMLLVPLQIGPHCTIKIKHLPDSEISWNGDQTICIKKKSVEVEISPGDNEAMLVVIGM